MSQLNKLTSLEEIPGIVNAVKESFEQRLLIPLAHRREQLERLQTQILQDRRALCIALEKDFQRPHSETEMLEITGILREISIALKHLSDWAKPSTVSWDVKVAVASPQVTKEPYGVVLVIGPWNYPYLCLIGPVISAIAAGNCVIAKPSITAPHSCAQMVRTLQKAFDPRIFQCVVGGVPETTELLKHRFDKICFTGPLEWDGKFVNAGQTCIAPDYALVHESLRDRFLKELRTAVMSFYPKCDEKTGDYSHIVDDAHYKNVKDILSRTKGKVYQHGTYHDESRFFPPTIVHDVKPDDAVMDQELLAPILPVIFVKSIGLYNVGPIIRKNDTPLAMYIFTDRNDEIEELRAIRSGSILVNDTLMQCCSPYVKFGGFGFSGNGSYHGKAGFDEFTHERPQMTMPKIVEVPFDYRYPPYTDTKKSLISGGVTSTYMPLIKGALNTLFRG